MKNLSRVIVVLALFLFIFPSPIQAANSLDVVINEIAWMGTKVEGVESKNWWRYEWIELYNNTNQTIMLDGWVIELFRITLDWSLELRGTILAQSYFLIVSSEKILPSFDLNYSSLGGNFLNSGQKVVLKDNLRKVIDSVDCFSSGKWFAGDNQTKQTMERISSQLSGTNDDNWRTSQDPGGTPKAKNSLVSETKIESLLKEVQVGLEETEPKITYPTGIIINEILPSPEGPDEENEWVEIFNQNDFEVDLSGWKMTDQIGVIKTYIFPEKTKVSAEGFLVLSRTMTKITLNNDGDGLNLVSPNEEIINSVNFQKAPLDQSYNLSEVGWSWSLTLTPGAKNIISTTSLQQGGEVRGTEKKETAFPKQSEEGKLIKEMGVITRQALKKSSHYFFVLLIALINALFSGIIILILKRKLKV